MSTSLFRSHQSGQRRSPKSLLISPPLMPISSSSSIPISNRSTVILKVIYDFQSESEIELSVKAGDYVRFLDKLDNGWLRVQHMERPDSGLVPAGYIDIEVNDAKRPVSKEWLNDASTSSIAMTHEGSYNKIKAGNLHKSTPGNFISTYKPKKSGFNSSFGTLDNEFDFFQRDKNPASTSPITRNFTISHLSVSQVLQCDNRFYYRIDMVVDTNVKKYMVKTYQDFYNLHVSLSEISIDYPLPKLPQPVRQQTKQSLLIRCNELNVYLNKLIKNKFFRVCQEFITWLDVDNEAATKNNDNDINQVLLPGSINISEEQVKYSTTAPLPRIKSNFSNESVHDYNDHNSKYSGYLNQSNNHKKLVKSNSNTTLHSYLSLIDRYDEVQGNDEQDDHDKPTSSESDGDHNSLFSVNDHGPSTPIMDEGQFDSTTPITPVIEKVDPSRSNQASKQASPTENISAENSHQNNTPIQQHNLYRLREMQEQALPIKQYVKVKVLLINQEDDNIILKVPRNIPNIIALKEQLSERLYKDKKLIHHYNFHCDGEFNDSIIMKYIRNNNKVNLEMVRVRK